MRLLTDRIHDRLIQLAHPLAMSGRDRHRLTQPQAVGIEQTGLSGPAFRLVGQQDDRLARLAHDLGKGLVERHDTGARIDQQQTDIRILDRDLGLGAHLRLQTFLFLVVIAGGVDQTQVHIAETAHGLTAVARDARPVIDNRQRLSRQAIEQRRFSHIGPSNDGDAGYKISHGFLAYRSASKRASSVTT